MGIYGDCILEGFFKRKKKIVPSKSDYDKVVSKLKPILNKHPEVKKYCRIVPYLPDSAQSFKIADILTYDTYNKFHNYDEFEELFGNGFDKIIAELEERLNDKSIKIDTDGDEDGGAVFIYKYEI